LITDAQIVTLAIAIILPMAMLIYSNSRITEIGETKQTLRAEMAAGFARIETAIERLAQ
jgi:hypothetical protein